MASDAPRLLLWDIDHTLIDSRGAGGDVYRRAFPAATGVELRRLGDFHGRTELGIIHETLALHGVEATAEVVSRLSDAVVDGFRAIAGELAGRGVVLPGAREALRSLGADPGFRQGLLTGNPAEVAEIKMTAFGLADDLDLGIGGYGDDHAERAELVGVARGRAERALGGPVPAERVVLIGDTPNDVAAALATGAHPVAVATGAYSVDDLRDAGAPAPLESLADLAALRAALG